MLADCNSSSYANLPPYNCKFFDYFRLKLGSFPLYIKNSSELVLSQYG